MYNFYVKTLLLIFMMSLCMLLPPTKTRVQAETTYFAQIVNEETYIYSSPTLGENNSEIFSLPKTYFVELLSIANDKYYYAKYKDIYGYVKKDSVRPILGTPTTPFLTGISFRVFVPSGATLRATPENLGSTNLIHSIPFLETNLEYYGTINGEEAITKKGYVWYYCKYYMNNLTYMGYIYAPLCDCLSTINLNDEKVEFITGELEFEQINKPDSVDGLENLSSTSQSLIIIAVSLPCLLFIYLLFKPSSIAKKESKTNRTARSNPRAKISRLKHSDYFELDDDFN